MTTTDRRIGVYGQGAIKLPCRVATTANITLSGEQTIDGVAVVSDDRVLVKNQTTGAENGIYVCDTGTWSRAADFDGANDCVQGTLVLVTSGTVNASTVYELTTSSPVIGTSSLTFAATGATALNLASAFMLTVLDDTTAAAARTTLGAAASSDLAAYIAAAIVDASGDLIVGTAADTVARLARGTAGQYLGISGSSLAWLSLDQRRAIADAAATVVNTDRLIAYTSLSANRTVTLPAATTFNAGQRLTIVDESGSASQTVAISLAPNGTDTIAGSNTTQVIINVPRGKCEIECNGSNGWHVVGEWCVRYSAVLGADVSLTNTGTYFDTVSVAQGTVGTWRAFAKVCVTSGAVANVNGKLWDATTVIDSGRETVAGASQAHMIPMSGDITTPAGNIKVSVNDASRTDGTAKYNFSGNSEDTSLLVWRIA